MFSKFSQSRDETATVFATSRTHVVSGSEAIHYARDHVRIVPIEVGNERVIRAMRPCRSNRCTCKCTWTHRKIFLQYGTSENASTQRVVWFRLLLVLQCRLYDFFFTLRRKPDFTDDVSGRKFQGFGGRKTPNL